MNVDIIALRVMLNENYPQSIWVLNALDAWEKGIVTNVNIVVDNCIEPSTVVVIIHDTKRAYVYAKEQKCLRDILKQNFQPEQYPCYLTLTNQITGDWIMTLFTLSDKNIIYKGKLWMLPDDLAINKREVPKGFYLSGLRSTDIATLAKHYIHSMDISNGLKYFELLISRYESVGLFTSTDSPQLVSWAVRHINGNIGHLFTLPEYRGQGLGTIIVKEMCVMIRENGDVPHLSSSNDISELFVKKLGFVEEFSCILLKY